MRTARQHPRIVLGPALAGSLMSTREFDAVEEYNENYRYELIRSILVVRPLPPASVRAAGEILGCLLRQHREERPRRQCIDATLPGEYIRLRRSRQIADRVAWVGLGRMPNLHKDVPTIVADFVTHALRDRVRDYETKRREYLKRGVQEYWIIDRFRRTMTAIINQTGKKEREKVVQEDEVYRTTLLPGFELELRRLFAAADTWKKGGR